MQKQIKRRLKDTKASHGTILSELLDILNENLANFKIIIVLYKTIFTILELWRIANKEKKK